MSYRSLILANPMRWLFAFSLWGGPRDARWVLRFTGRANSSAEPPWVQFLTAGGCQSQPAEGSTRAEIGVTASRCPFPVDPCGRRLISPAAACDVTRASAAGVFIAGQPCRRGATRLPSVALPPAPPEGTQGPTMNHSVSMDAWVWPGVKGI